MGKGANLLYKASRDGLSQKVFWEKCLGHKETIVLVQTHMNSVIGGYCPDQWEDTTGKKNSEGFLNYKDIVSGKPFLFYWLIDQIEIIKHRDDIIPSMRSEKDCLMEFGGGLYISAVQIKESSAFASVDYFVHPFNTGDLTIEDERYLFFSGGNYSTFKSVDVEVWGLH
jgi:hypothetical protein